MEAAPSHLAQGQERSCAPVPFFMSQGFQLSWPKYGQISCSRKVLQSWLLLGEGGMRNATRAKLWFSTISFLYLLTLIAKLPICPEVLKTNGAHVGFAILTDWAWKCKFTPLVSIQLLLTEQFNPCTRSPSPGAPQTAALGSRGCSCPGCGRCSSCLALQSGDLAAALPRLCLSDHAPGSAFPEHCPH